jgi:putative ABC transport system permease protein
MLKNYFKVAIRNINKFKIYTILNILGLSIGTACCLIILTFVEHEFSYDTFHSKSDRIYRVLIHHENNQKIRSSYQPFITHVLSEYLLDYFPQVENAVRLIPDNPFVKKSDIANKERNFYFVDPSIFEIFDLPFKYGDPKTALKEPYTIVLTESMAKKYFGDINPVGETLKLNNFRCYDNSENEILFKITGVMKNHPSNSSLDFEIITSISSFNKNLLDNINDWRASSSITYLLLRSPSDESGINSILSKIAKEKYTEIPASLILQPLTDIHLDKQNLDAPRSGGTYISYYPFISFALLILILACLNYINLTTARATTRKNEVGYRKVYGAKRSQIIIQFLGESIILSFFGFLFAIGLVELFLPIFNDFINKNLKFDLFQNVNLLIGSLLLVIITAVLAGSYPAFYLSRFNPVKIFRNESNEKRYRGILRKIFVIVQFSVTIFFSIYATVIISQVEYIKNKDLGYEKDKLIIIKLQSPEITKKYQLLKQSFNKIPEVVSSSITGSSLYFYSSFGDSFKIEEDSMTTDIRTLRVDNDYLKTVGLRLIAGKWFQDEFGEDAKSGIVINETAAKEFGWSNPIGKKFYKSNRVFQVIGVVKDFNYETLQHKIEPLVLQILTDWLQFYNSMLVRVNSYDYQNILYKLREKWNEILPDKTFEYSFFEDEIEKVHKSEIKLSKLFFIIAGLALFIASLGLLGLVMFTTERRTKEIGIRKIHGATIWQIFKMIVEEFLLLVLISIFIVLPYAYFETSRWLQIYAFRINLSIWIFILSAALAFVIALLTVSFQAIRAARANPAEMLRYE